MTQARQAKVADVIHTAKVRGWSNGMATDPATVELEWCYLKVVRKAPHPDHPETLLFTVVPKNEYVNPDTRTCDVDTDDIADDIQSVSDMYGDVQVTFTDDPQPTAVLAVDLFSDV